MRVGKPVEVEFVGKDKSLGRTIDGAESRMSRLGGKVKALGKVMALGLAGGAVIAGTALLHAGEKASDLNETVSKSQQIFGKSGAHTLQKWAERADTALGQSKQTALDAAATFGVFGKSAGLTGQKLTGFSTEMTKLASDMASFNNTSPEQAIEAIGAALRGESEPIRQYGVLLDDATLRNEALRMGLIKTTKEALTPSQKVLAAQAAILKQTSDQQGDFARTSDGLANKQRIITAQWENMQATMGQKVLPIMVAVAGFVLTQVIPAVSHLSSWLSTRLSPAFQRLGDYVRNRVIPAFQQASAWARQNLVPALSAVASFVVTRLVPAIARLYEWMLTKLAPAVARGVVPVIRSLKGVFDDVRAALERNKPEIDKTKEALKKTAEFIVTKVIPVLLKMEAAFIDHVGPILADAIDGFAAMVTAVDKVVGAVKSLIGWLDKIHVPDALGKIGSGIGKVVGHANGTGFSTGGMRVVGERGPELVDLPRGSRVIPNGRARNMGGGGRRGGDARAVVDLRIGGQVIERLLIEWQRDSGRPLQVSTI